MSIKSSKKILAYCCFYRTFFASLPIPQGKYIPLPGVDFAPNLALPLGELPKAERANLGSTFGGAVKNL